jgi:gamma-glutamylcyclotransferase (GGCT)/AIG2-like uncharacterized protein YtfP
MPEAKPSNTPEPQSPPERFVFVYGTLRRGDDNDINRLTPAPVFVGAAHIKARMFHLGRYPGVLLGPAQGDTDVLGEVYAITPELERKLDEIEELYPQQTDEYFKRDIVVRVGTQTVPCIVYEINPAYVVGKPVIQSGDWVKDR